LQKLTVIKSNGKYEVISPLGMPTHFDKIVLYAVLYLFLKKTGTESRELETTRYAIAKCIFDCKITDMDQLHRIVNSLKRWSSVSIHFEGIFYEDEAHTTRFFHIIDDVILNQKTKKLCIRFNEQYLDYIRQTKYYKLINFNEYKN
jgi:hypothetical protein